MVLINTLKTLNTRSLLFWIACFLSTSLYSQGDQSDIERSISIINVEHKGDHRLRIYLRAIERSGNIQYPISTIDRDMVSVQFQNTSTPPAHAKSLGILGSQSTDLRRALFVAFNLDSSLSGRELTEVRARVSELVADLPAEYLTVAALANGSARVIADTTPEKNDNINRIQQQLAALSSEGNGPVLSETLCAAAERFHSWNLKDFKRSDQKILVIVAPQGDAPTTERFRAENCWRSLTEQNVRVFQIAFGNNSKTIFDLKSVIEESNGFVHTVKSPLDILAAAKNIVSLLKNEYVLDVDAPDISLEDQPLELTVKVSYHESIIQSKLYNLGFVIPTLASVFSSKSKNAKSEDELNQDMNYQRKIQFISFVTVLILLLVLAYAFYKFAKKRSETLSCDTCGLRVRKDYANCSFRNSESIARLVVISGPLAGRMIPLRRGPNQISSKSRQGVRLPGAGIKWFNHGVLVIDGQRVAYTPKKHGFDLINGWPVLETKLIGQGHVLKIGSNLLRFEIKPQSIYH